MKIAVLGAAGRMGQALTRVLVETPGCAVAAGIETKGSPHVGRDLGELAGLAPLGIAITDDPLPVFAHVDGVLDFTTPASTVAFAGLSAQGRSFMSSARPASPRRTRRKSRPPPATHTIVKAGNMSQGVNLLAALASRAA